LHRAQTQKLFLAIIAVQAAFTTGGRDGQKLLCSLENIWAKNVTHREDDLAANHCNGQFRGGGK